MLVGSRSMWHGAAAAALAAAVLAGAAAVQRPPAPSPSSASKAGDGLPTMRERLDWRARGLEQRAVMLREAIAKLDAGESEHEVRRFLDTNSAFARLLGDPGAADDARAADPERLGPPGGRRRPGPGAGPGREAGAGAGERPGPRERPHGGDRREGPGLTEEEREVMLELLQKTSPDRVPEVMADPERMRRLGMMVRWLVEMRRRDRVAYDLKLELMGHEARAVSLAGSIAKRVVPVVVEEDKVVQFRKELRETAGRVFDLRIAEQTHELAQLEARLETIRAEIASQEARREALIDEQIAKLMQAATRWAEEKAKGQGSAGEERDLPVPDVERGRPVPAAPPR